MSQKKKKDSERPPPKKKLSNPAMVTSEVAFIAESFSKELEKLMNDYHVTDYDVLVKSPIFQLRFSSPKKK